MIHSRSHRSFKLSPLDYYEIFNEISIYASNVSDLSLLLDRSRCDSNSKSFHARNFRILFLDEGGNGFSMDEIERVASNVRT